MGKLHKKKDGSFYINHSWIRDGRKVHVTYQVNSDGVNELRNKGYQDESKIPAALIAELNEKKLIYTGKSGPGESDDSEFEPLEMFEKMDQLRDQVRKWIWKRLSLHPDY